MIVGSAYAKPTIMERITMTTQHLYQTCAAEIMAMVDDSQTEPFTWERRKLEERICVKLAEVTGLAADEDDAAYQAGYDVGRQDKN